MKLGKRFILMGSSARKLRAADVNLLGGRAIRKNIYPFLLAEITDSYSFEQALQYGMLPLVLQSDHKPETLDAYISLYMQQEVYQESLVRNIGDFARFLEAASFSQGAVLNISNIGRDCGVGRKTVEGYLQILYDILLAFELPVFRKKAVRAMSAHPKFYFFDAGVFRALRPKGPLDRPEEIGGAALEGLVAQHLRAWIDYSGSGYTLSYWRSLRGLEVDFVLYGDAGFYAFEVKNSNRLRPSDLTGLTEFGEDYPESRRILLYRGSERLLEQGILMLPVDTFLAALRPDVAMADIL
jgi:predicted AAA+ superfamily ATPase